MLIASLTLIYLLCGAAFFRWVLSLCRPLEHRDYLVLAGLSLGWPWFLGAGVVARYRW